MGILNDAAVEVLALAPETGFIKVRCEEVTVVRVDHSEEQRDYVVLKTDMTRVNDGQVIITVESEIVLESATLGNGASFPLHLYGIGDAAGARPL